VIYCDTTGITGPTGIPGITGPTGNFNGQLIYGSIIPGIDNSFNLGSENRQFRAAYIRSGQFGPLISDGTDIFPVNGNVHLGSTGQRFGQIYTDELFVGANHSMIALDQSLNQMYMSFLMDSGKVNYKYVDASGNTKGNVYGVHTSQGDPTRIDSSFLPNFNSLRFISSFNPGNNNLDNLLTSVFSSIPSSVGLSDISDTLLFTSGLYVICVDSSHVSVPVNHVVNVYNSLNGLNYVLNESLDVSQNTFMDIHTNNIIDIFNYGNFINRSDNPIISSSFKIRNQTRFQERYGFFYNYLQPYYYFKNSPKDGVNIYTFSLYPEEIQPSGTINLGNVDSKNLIVSLGKYNNSSDSYLTYFGSGNIRIFAFSYNNLSVAKGYTLLSYDL
jgi:hypothetical protein